MKGLWGESVLIPTFSLRASLATRLFGVFTTKLFPVLLASAPVLLLEQGYIFYSIFLNFRYLFLRSI